MIENGVPPLPLTLSLEVTTMKKPVELTCGPRVLQFCELCARSGVGAGLIGESGVGKSALAQELAARLGRPCVLLNTPMLEPSDFGFPVVGATGVTYALPAHLLLDRPSIVVYEELNRAQPLTRSSLLSVITARTLHGHAIHPEVVFVATMNPPDGGPEIDDLSPALENRFLWARVLPPTAGDWSTFARPTHAPILVDYVAALDEPFATASPRDFSAASRLIRTYDEGATEKSTLLEGLTCAVGLNHAQAIASLVTAPTDRALDPQVVLNHWSAAHADRIRKQRVERVDLVASAAHRLAQALEANAALALDPNVRGNVASFLAELPPDLTVRILQKYAAVRITVSEYDLPPRRA